MSPAEGRRRAATYWLDKARRSLASARAEAAADRTDFAINRCYYAAFYAVTAVLVSRGHRFSKHSGVRAAVHRELVKAGLLPVELGQFYDQLFEDRQRGDYLDFVSFTVEEVAEAIPRVEGLVVQLEQLVVGEDA